MSSLARHRGGRVRGRGSVAAEGGQTVLRDNCEKYDALGAGSADPVTSRSLPSRLSALEQLLARAHFGSARSGGGAVGSGPAKHPRLFTYDLKDRKKQLGDF